MRSKDRVALHHETVVVVVVVVAEVAAGEWRWQQTTTVKRVGCHMQRNEMLEAVDRLFPYYYLYHGRFNETENGVAEPRRSIHRLPVLPDNLARHSSARHSTSNDNTYNQRAQIF